ncbi:MAG: 50S ribosomal protein L6 [Phycisphaerales bacterium]|nr:50S ribosomal protein L6 [Phycisphaerales bacterium]
MSRIGKKPITVPGNVKVAISGQAVTITGPKTNLTINVDPDVKVTWAESEKAIRLAIDDSKKEDRFVRARWGTSRALINNAIKGVTDGYEKTMEVVGVGWTAAIQGKKLKLVVGFANAIMLDIPAGLDVAVDKQFVKVRGADRQKVGQFAAEMRALRKPEPYNGKGIKYQTETIKKKQGKQFGA